MAAEIIKLVLIWLHCLHPSFVSLSLLIWFRVCFWVDFTADSVVPRGKFASSNQKHNSDLGSDTSSVWNFCTRSSDVNSWGNHWGVGCFLRLYYSGRVPGARPPLFFDQNEARRAEKSFLETAPPYLRVWMTAPPPPPLSEGLDPLLIVVFIFLWIPVGNNHEHHRSLWSCHYSSWHILSTRYK